VSALPDSSVARRPVFVGAGLDQSRHTRDGCALPDPTTGSAGRWRA